jgi:hypothetical protein
MLTEIIQACRGDPLGGPPPFKSSTRLGKLAALAPEASFRGPQSSRLAFKQKNLPFPEAAPSSRSLSPTVSEKLRAMVVPLSQGLNI